MEPYILSVFVANESGVLARVSMLFGRRGYNIDSLTVSATDEAEVSRITLTVRGDEGILEQIEQQLLKLQEVLKVERMDRSRSLCRELLLIKLSVPPRQRMEAKVAAEGLGARLMEEARESLIFEMTARPDRIDLFLREMAEYPILEMCRTGMTAMEYENPKQEETL